MADGPDALLAMAKSAESALATSSADDLDQLETALDGALEAARHFRAQIDLGQRVDVPRLLAFEALFRSTIDVQPLLAGEEIDGTVTALQSQTPRADGLERLGAVRANAFVVARALFDTLRSGYRIGYDVEEKS